MRILQLCKKFPYPLHDGEVIAIHRLTQAFSEEGCKVTVLALNTKKHHTDLDSIPQEIRSLAKYIAVYIDTDIRWYKALLNLFSSRSYHIDRFLSDDFSSKLQVLLETETYDIIHLEGLYLMPYLPIIRKYSKALVSLRAHNVEHEIWERLSSNERNPLKRWYLNILTSRLRKFEVSQLNKADLLVAITEKDLNKFRHLGCTLPALVSPASVGNIIPCEPAICNDLCYIGGLDWLPNQEGLSWFRENCFMELKREHPLLQFHIAGRNMPHYMNAWNKDGTVVYGEVADARDFLCNHGILIVPLHSGSGMRIKIIEAMALGKVVVATSIAAEGIDCVHQEDIWLADSVEEWIYALNSLLKDPDLCARISARASKKALDRYHYRKVGARLLAFYRDPLA